MCFSEGQRLISDVTTLVLPGTFDSSAAQYGYSLFTATTILTARALCDEKWY